MASAPFAGSHLWPVVVVACCRSVGGKSLLDQSMHMNPWNFLCCPVEPRSQQMTGIKWWQTHTCAKDKRFRLFHPWTCLTSHRNVFFRRRSSWAVFFLRTMSSDVGVLDIMRAGVALSSVCSRGYLFMWLAEISLDCLLLPRYLIAYFHPNILYLEFSHCFFKYAAEQPPYKSANFRFPIENACGCGQIVSSLI